MDIILYFPTSQITGFPNDIDVMNEANDVGGTLSSLLATKGAVGIPMFMSPEREIKYVVLPEGDMFDLLIMNTG